MKIQRGGVVIASLEPVRGSEQGGTRPVLIIQNDIGNEAASTTIVAPLTTKRFSRGYPTNVELPRGVSGLKFDSTVLLSQIRTIDKTRLEKKIGYLPESYMEKIGQAIKISLGLF